VSFILSILSCNVCILHLVSYSYCAVLCCAVLSCTLPTLHVVLSSFYVYLELFLWHTIRISCFHVYGIVCCYSLFVHSSLLFSIFKPNSHSHLQLETGQKKLQVLVHYCTSLAHITYQILYIYRRWFGPGRIPRDFRSYQAVLTMHIWFLHKRLIMNTDDPHRAALIQEELFDIVWQDSSNRMRAHGVNEWLITKNLKTVQQYTFMHCFHYDHCYTELLDDPQERLAELKNLVLTHVLVLNPDGNEQARLDHDDQATRLAWYIEAQYQNIVHDLPQELFEQACMAWVDLPDFAALKDSRGKEMGDNPIHMDDVLPEKWVRNIANDGTYYYWNVETREAQWERPL
jgi:hypothetical protein